MKKLALCLLVFSLSACATGQGRPDLPYDAWNIFIGQPLYMETWVESVDVVDQHGLAFERVHGGIAGDIGSTAGWPKNGVGGGGKPIGGVDLPEIIFVRWQSLVEPQTYNVRINIPQWVRDEMVKPERAYCRGSKQWETNYRKIISIGLAPGGIAKVWLGGGCLDNKEIGRFVGVINEIGPYNGTSGGKHRPLIDKAKAYIEKHAIPYGSW